MRIHQTVERVQREVEAVLGGCLLRCIKWYWLRKAGLVEKQIILPDGQSVYYYERPAKNSSKNDAHPTILICHGLTDEPSNYASMVAHLIANFKQDRRVLVPDLTGHGRDLARVQERGIDSFEYPDMNRLVKTMEDFLTYLEVKECYAIGKSLGGCLVYWLQQRRPNLIPKTVLISPALESVMDQAMLEDIIQRRRNLMCVESRQDVQELFRFMSCPQRQRNDPVPAFLLEAFWRDRQRREPHGHFRKYLGKVLLEERGRDLARMSSRTDVAPHLRRLVIWPQDDAVADHDKGQSFFAQSLHTTFKSIPDCGHVFHANGSQVTKNAAPLAATFLSDDGCED